MTQFPSQFSIQSQSVPRYLEQRLPDIAERRRMAALRSAGVSKDASQARALLDQVRAADDELH